MRRHGTIVVPPNRRRSSGIPVSVLRPHPDEASMTELLQPPKMPTSSLIDGQGVLRYSMNAPGSYQTTVSD